MMLQSRNHVLSVCLKLLLLAVLFAFNNATVFAQVKELRFSDTNDLSRLVLELEQENKFTYFSLTNPNRLVVDIQGLDRNFSLANLNVSGDKVSRIRHSKPKTAADTRIVIETSKKLNPRLFMLAPNDSSANYRLVIELVDPNPAPKPLVTASSATNESQGPKRDKDIIIVIDPGHGGADPGSIGPAGTYEKNITLSISKMLAKRINKEPGLRAVLTRESDFYISPNDRPKIAVRENADLLVSVHADAFTTPQPRGGSVWVLSKGRADSELGRLLERTERSSELFGPAAEVIEDRDTERYFAETILNMSMDLSRAHSYELSNDVIKDMQKITRMHKRIPQSASLAVLTASGIPSILVEVGFISNPQEEKNLLWAEYRQRLADSLMKSIRRYFKRKPPEGTLWAQWKNQAPTEHTVARGESLSVIAQQYGVSVKQIKQQNNLKSDLVRIGQVLKINKQ